MDREKLKLLIECSTTFEKADEVISQHGKFENAKEKIAFLQEAFDAEMLDRKEEDSDEFVYECLLSSVVKHNFE